METPTLTREGQHPPVPADTGVPIKVRVGDIDRGDNPRPESEIDPAYIKELAESMKAIGLLQYPVVQQKPDGRYALVVGECRTLAWKLAFGDDAEINVLLTAKDKKAWLDAAALTENVLRRAMSQVAEAESAARMLGHCNGDRDHAARLLGWERPKLDRRLSLMYAIPAVRNALHEKKISLGHAELLATCRKEAQEQAIELLLKQEAAGKLMSVGDFKAFLENKALVLDKAIFDKSECVGCHHNSSNQSALFAEVISGQKCTNKACFDLKTEAELERRKAELEPHYQVVKIVRPGENYTVVHVTADGPRGVGPEQAKACRTCKSFGAVVSAVPDKLGQVFKDQCSDLPCHVRMVAAHHKADTVEGIPEGSDASAKPKRASAGASAPAKKGGSAKQPGKAPQRVATSEPTTRVKEYREKLWRTMFKNVVSTLDLVRNRSVLLALAMSRPAALDSYALTDTLRPAVDVGTAHSPAEMLRALLDVDQKTLSKALDQIAAHVGAGQSGLEIRDVTAILDVFEIQVADHWKVDKEFLELLTTNEIDQVCDDLGVKTAMGAEAYAKAQKQKKDVYIDAILATPGFDFSGRVPHFMTW